MVDAVCEEGQSSNPPDPLALSEKVVEKLQAHGLLPRPWSSGDSALKGKKVDTLLNDARSREAALAAMHVLATRMVTVSEQGVTLILDAGQIPMSSPSSRCVQHPNLCAPPPRVMAASL